MTKQPYVGYVVKRYPRFSETFIVNEILAHERVGMKIDIFALGNVEETHFQDIIAQVRAPVTRIVDKQRNMERYWALFDRAWRELPGFADCLAAQRHPNVHEFAQAILLALAIRERGIEHLHAHFGTRATTVARIAARLSGIGYSFTAHAKDIYYPYQESTELENKLRDAVQAITVSDYNLAHLRQRYGKNADRTIRLYNGLDLQKFSFTLNNNRQPEILAVGRLVEKKGFCHLISALRLLHDRRLSLRCRIIGDGPLHAVLLAQIRNLGLEQVVTLSGFLPQREIITAMRNALMVVAPCIVSEEGDRDGLPTVLLEAMALGTPVIATRVAGIPELVIEGKTGCCVAPGDSAALTEAITRLADSEEFRIRLAYEARALIEQEFDIDCNTRQLREIFAAAAARLSSVRGENA
ncbi:glycosyltransferase family 4 protein [Jejubacter calystegiae]|uniref:Glycosyltransferase family 4 protein n=1 Tax=Jejubacter calystegiae TaxID=2579935 RepID=A0A4P8YPC9_9ENTR|nr:glycosyltransferase family 4 protein [Jejubacter calystegiae]QCT21838.1 glycosyltransferase family 4 protein [Jejubacter calystegiae]